MGLNAGATTFMPEEIDDLDKSSESTGTSETTPDSFNEYKEMVDNFDGLGSDTQQPHHIGEPPHTVTGDDKTNSMELPPDMAKHAAEFWFPECRDCACCQGFKYGCMCAPSNNGVCMCVTGVPDDVSVLTMNSYDLYYQQLLLQVQPFVRRCSRRRVRGNSRHGKTNDPCRFFFSAVGCRYGDACPFSHKKQE